MFEKKEPKQFPVDKIRTMTKMGIEEREIVKQLKSEGYSFSEIESAMMQVMKEGVGMPSQQPMQQSSQDDSLNLAWPRLERTEEMLPQSEELSPEVAMEDLVENIVYEKLESYNRKMKDFTEHLGAVNERIRVLEHGEEAKPIFELPKEIEDRIDSIEAKVIGLERAFKNALPALTASIEELKKSIDSLKNNHVVTAKIEGPEKGQMYERYYPNIPLFPRAEKIEA
ncbi:MAG: hypothetical protein HZB65_04400 [Candidatus Aenigmarchaeota archaeon]|nr:hypothetical protein [Candidatus Aenigmarchaeota archaeon]